MYSLELWSFAKLKETRLNTSAMVVTADWEEKESQLTISIGKKNKMHVKCKSVMHFILFYHRGPAQCVGVADCYYIVNALDLPFASPIAIYR